MSTDETWREEPDPHWQGYRWRCRYLQLEWCGNFAGASWTVLDYDRFRRAAVVVIGDADEWLRCTPERPHGGFIGTPTPERRALWASLFVNP